MWHYIIGCTIISQKFLDTAHKNQHHFLYIILFTMLNPLQALFASGQFSELSIPITEVCTFVRVTYKIDTELEEDGMILLNIFL